MRARLGLLLASTLMGLVIAEMAARGFDLSKTWTSYVGQDLRPALTVTREPVGFTRLPSTRWPMPLGKTFASNSLGFRDGEFVRDKRPGRSRIAFLGDSVTEGYGVEVAERYCEVTRDRLEASSPGSWETLGFGVIAHSTADELVVLERHVLAYTPDLVVVQFGFNDIALNTQKLSLVAGGPPGTDPPQPRRPAGFKAFLQRHSALYLAVAERASLLRLKQGGHSAILDALLETRPEDWAATRELLTRLFALCRARRIPVLVTFFPST